MQKKLLAVAVGATLAATPMLAQAAKVTVYGRAEVEAVNMSSDTGTVFDGWQQGDTNGLSRWGVKADQDLGNGLKAFAKFEFSLDPSNGAAEDARGQYVGLKGGFGALTLGRDAGAYKESGGGKWDPYGATFMQARRAGGQSGDTFGHNGFRNDLIGYETPEGLGGLWGRVQFVLDESNGADGEYHAAAGWQGGPIEIHVATNNDAANGDRKNSKIAARYKSGGFSIFGQYEDVDHGGSIRTNGDRVGAGSGVTLGEGSFFLVGAGYKFGNSVLHGNIGGFSSDDTSPDVDYMAIGITHFFDKKTRIYAGYSNIDVNGVDNVDLYGAGIRFDF